MLYPLQNKYRNKLDLSGIWDFQIDPNQSGDAHGWQIGLENPRPIAVPGSWNEQYADLYNYLSLAWYLKKTYVPRSWHGQRIFLRIGSACYHSTVYINGINVGSHEGGHLPFAFDITAHVRWESENVIAISVENDLKPERVPSGNMDTPLLPVANFPRTTFDFFPFSGIHRPVILYSVPSTYIDDVTVTSGIQDKDGILSIAVRINAPVSLQGTALLTCPDGAIKSALIFENGLAQTEIIVPNAKLWSDQHPFLYDLSLQTAADQYDLKVGIRTVSVVDDQILLNGKPVQLNGFGRHEDFFASGRGLNLPLMVKDYQLMRWTGANSYRTSHYPYSEEEMQLADREGFLIINEIPAVSLQFEDDAKIAARLNQSLQQINELVARDKNHPSVVMWSIANEPLMPRTDLAKMDKSGDSAEVKGKAFLEQLMGQARQLDPTRLVTFAAIGGCPASWMEHCDVVCINRYWGWYVQGGELDKALVALEQELDALWVKWQKPIIITEFGADTIAGMHGPPDLMWTEEYQAELIRGYLTVAAKKNYIAGMQVWNFADFAAVQSILRVGGMNMKGVFTRQRTPKRAAYVLKEFWDK